MPARVVQRFPTSRLVYVSTGNVYGVTQTALGGASESWDEDPVGEYAASRLGGERLVTYYSALQQTPAVIIRLFYATELRYGIVLDVARKVWRRRPIDLTVGHVNQIWQGDANAYLARCFPLCDSPPPVYNLTGPETLSIRRLAARLGHFMGVEPIFEGTESEASLLGNADKLISLLGPPEVDMEAVVEWVASWVMHGGRVLDKPTMYERRDGRF
jgi:nucleoside-diphosphate-sugar epimerase